MDIAFALPIPIDELHNTAIIRYHAHPTRLYRIDSDNRIAFAGKPGPFRTDLEAFAKALTATRSQ